jgi:hypothetical protein
MRPLGDGSATTLRRSPGNRPLIAVPRRLFVGLPSRGNAPTLGNGLQRCNRATVVVSVGPMCATTLRLLHASAVDHHAVAALVTIPWHRWSPCRGTVGHHAVALLTEIQRGWAAIRAESAGGTATTRPISSGIVRQEQLSTHPRGRWVSVVRLSGRCSGEPAQCHWISAVRTTTDTPRRRRVCENRRPSLELKVAGWSSGSSSGS